MQKSLRYPMACTIAGSDSGGGAGIQADLKTFSALGVFGTSVITAITAQNTLGVTGIQAISPEILSKQLNAVFEDFAPNAVKIGMLHNAEAVRIIADAIDAFCPKYVVLDPVMISESGSKLIESETISVIVSELFRRATLITPNIFEAEILSGIKIENDDDMISGAYTLIEKGAQAVLLKGGHRIGVEKTDYLVVKESDPMTFSLPTVYTKNTHGTGCTLSSAIAAYLALGKELKEAVWLAKVYLTKALQAGSDVTIGKGSGPVNHFFDPKRMTVQS
ncbi:MAG: bifunctional hydroxymethylpyrimidine kinase/phosphomethylpyrimidine kinase [Bacteroidales bacterium]|jgi:hydroxymethylpyrimidine/phosphomethylpyrimidine kinase|nr:bifunctional hydroxymethylpyrimidine kinase/phosphomethylpyrimidine kinase [Bacteroidales bacterium]